ncbi:MAG: PSD1 and planctomycete cytochrome C domain-containing protein [Pirellulaceae bacterium]|nr:PSD1 and planctomycete cytochrome C domain-containing protein [Pirellulaceae bacterium]
MDRGIAWVLCLAACVLAGTQVAGAADGDDAGAARPLSFNRDIRPILADKCFACHGQDAKAREADLRLDTLEGATADLGGSQAIVPGDPDASALWERISSDDEDVVMPPPDAHKPMTEAEKTRLRQWIEQGAPYQKHWAFEPIERPAPPSGPGATHPVDAFLAVPLQAAGLTPQPVADRATLIRRVAFALTGLPPTLSEVDAFLADDSPQAYERMVDRYLASPRYGEEMARHWLDVARYADTHGLHLDNERQMWLYRDWVVNAFNQNLPFDTFSLWQVAGDLLPDPTPQQLVATGFNRCNVTTSEGGAIDAEFAYRYAVERTTTVAQAWLGLTAGCAVCHDHKYDPLPMREFYELYAFFNDAADPPMDGNINTTPPFLKVPTPEQRAAGESAAHIEQQARQWLMSLATLTEYRDPAAVGDPDARRPVSEVLFDDAFPPGAVTRSSSRNAIRWVVDPVPGAAAGRRVIRQAHAVDCDDTVEFKLRPMVVPHDARVEWQVRVAAPDIPESLRLTALGRGSVTWQRDGETLVREGHAESPVPAGAWVRLSVPAADLGLQPGDRLEGVTLAQRGGVVDWDELILSGQSAPAVDPLESLTAWRKMLGQAIPPELPAELHPLIQGGADKELSAEDALKLRTYYVALIARPVTAELATARQIWEAARIARLVADESAAGTFIYRDQATPRESFVMLRGQYDKPGDPVVPGVPRVLPQIAKPDPTARLNRLDLAQWLVAAENPLTARVIANRFWQQFFGTGLVKTSYDFGTRGDPPSHPELLDYLASELRETGWDVKRFVKWLLLSDAFQRDALATPEMLALDPANRLLAHGPRFRLDAEQVRDNALYVSGLLNLEMGGPGVRPYQPPNIWEPVGYADSNTRFYLQDHGGSLYRRSLYVFLKRTAPPPFMSNFDGPNREQSCLVRERSNTPLQALQLMNDVQHVEAARALAERALSEGGGSCEDRITFLYRTVLARPPSPDELNIVRAGLDRQRALYAAEPHRATELVETGESAPRRIASDIDTAAWTMVANVLLNADESLNRN